MKLMKHNFQFLAPEGGQICPLTHVALSYSQIDIVTYVRSCWRLTAQLTEFCLFVFVALRPMSTAMVIAGRSVHLTTLFPGQA